MGRDSWQQRELTLHEELYSGFAQILFAMPAVRALRRHLVRRILTVSGAGKASRVLSLGCGIGDTELLLAPRVGFIAGFDLTPAAIRQAREDAARLAIANAEFCEGAVQRVKFAESGFDAAIGIFFLHHLPASELPGAIQRIHGWLKPGGTFYGLDPNRWRLAGALGRLLVPHLMHRYQTPDERELKPAEIVRLFRAAGFQIRSRCYDFVSTPLAGLLPSWGFGYRAARLADEALIRIPLLRALGSNFEWIARK
jgi:SAM-dependent methyltransferase